MKMRVNKGRRYQMSACVDLFGSLCLDIVIYGCDTTIFAGDVDPALIVGKRCVSNDQIEHFGPYLCPLNHGVSNALG